MSDYTGVVVTTPWNASEENRLRAAELTVWFSGAYVERQGRSIEAMFRAVHESHLVVSGDRPLLYQRSRPHDPLFFHPSLAVQRIAKLQQGERDRLVAAAGIRPGDHVIDATLGLGADTLVLAEAVGPDGHVMSLEASFVLARLFQYAQKHADKQDERVQHLFGRITVVVGPHRTVLTELPDASVDVVYFDPMFRLAPDRVSSIDPLRQFAVSDPVSEEAWIEAKRVAKRTVVMKERARSGEFERFGLVPDRPRARFAFGVWHRES